MICSGGRRCEVGGQRIVSIAVNIDETKLESIIGSICKCKRQSTIWEVTIRQIRLSCDGSSVLSKCIELGFSNYRPYGGCW